MMKLLIITDIFGRTKALDDFANYFDEKPISIEIVDPYNGEYRNFDTEAHAYKSFQKEIGLDNYTNLLRQKVKNVNSKRVVLLGFSVGASAIWAASQHIDIEEKLYKGICFYSSQIRNYLDTNPNFEIELYFAESEPSYEVGEVATNLAKKKRVECFSTNYMHGFMNKLSKNFNEKGFYKYQKIIKYCIIKYLT